MLKLENVRLVSSTSDGVAGQGNNYASSLSGDGKFVIFNHYTGSPANPTTSIGIKNLETGELNYTSVNKLSESAPVFVGDTNHFAYSDGKRIYIKNAGTGETEYSSVNLHGQPTQNIATSFDVSSNGNIAFLHLGEYGDDWRTTKETLIYNVTTKHYTYLDRSIPETIEYPIFSADGKYVAYSSQSFYLAPGDGNYMDDIFVQNLQSGDIRRVSTSKDGVLAERDPLFEREYQASTRPVFSPDGKNIFFTSSASNLVAGDENHEYDIFMKNLITSDIQLVTRAKWGSQANGYSRPLAVSPDGNKLIFISSANNLVVDDTNNYDDVFIKDLKTGDVLRVNLDGSGFEGAGLHYASVENSHSVSVNGYEGGFSLVFTAKTIIDGKESSQVFVADYSDKPDWYGTEENDTYTGTAESEWLKALGGNDIIYGGAGEDTISGGAGLDNLFGGNGNDFIDAGTKNDRLYGENGHDTLIGGWGADTLVGGTGGDVMTGGLDADIFVFNNRNESITIARDVITDFAQGADKIKLAASMGFHAIHEGAADGDLLGFHFEGANTIVESEHHDFVLVLNGHINLTNSDFIFA